MFEKKIVLATTLSIIALCLSRSVALNRDENALGSIHRELEKEVWHFATSWAGIEPGPLATYVDRGKTSKLDVMMRWEGSSHTHLVPVTFKVYRDVRGRSPHTQDL